MGQSLRLEFTCTEAERKEAQSLVLRRRLGGGSKVLTTFVLLLMLVGMLLGFYFRVRREVASEYRPLAYGAVFLIAAIAWVAQRRLRMRKAEPAATRLEISEDGLAVLGAGADLRSPWSAFRELLESPELFALVTRDGNALVVIPRRVFPDESAQDSFQTLANNHLGLAEPPSDAVRALPPAATDWAIRICIRLGLRDALDFTLASWKTRSLVGGLLGMMLVTILVAAAKPQPNAVFSAWQMLLYFGLPFLMIQGAFIVTVVTILNWRMLSRNRARCELWVSPEVIGYSEPDWSGSLPWTTYDCYKETPWSLIVWKARGSAWLLLPKRAFQSADDLREFRELLAQRLEPSSWFFG